MKVASFVTCQQLLNAFGDLTQLKGTTCASSNSEPVYKVCESLRIDVRHLTQVDENVADTLLYEAVQYGSVPPEGSRCR